MRRIYTREADVKTFLRYRWKTRDGTVAQWRYLINMYVRRYTYKCIYIYINNKMLPLNPGEFMRPFLLTFTLILVIHKHELLNLIQCTVYDYIHLLTFAPCSTRDDVCDSRQAAATFQSKNIHGPAVHRINNLSLPNERFSRPSDTLIYF